MISGDEFFESPRDWSLLKYKILGCYFSKYFPKVNNQLGMGAIVADLFAGRGRFEDGSEGSPLILAKQAKIYNERLGFQNRIILSEEIEGDREKLKENLKLYVDSNVASIIPGDARDAGELLMASIMPGVPLFVFLDPFGIRGLSVELLHKILKRARSDSTELLVNFNHRAIPRLAGICNNLNSANDKFRKQALSVHEMVGEALGGNWWLNTMNDGALPEEERAIRVMNQYAELYRTAFKWLVMIPVPRLFRTVGRQSTS